MKKIFHEEKYRLYQAKKSSKALKHIQRKNREKQRWQGRPLRTNRYALVHKEKDQVTISAPQDFSLLNNLDETLSFFTEVDFHIHQKHNIYLDLSNVKKLSNDVILYMLSRIEYNRSRSTDKVRIKGNAPTDERCREIFHNSGFYDYVYATRKKPFLRSDFNVYSIQSDRIVLGTKADEVASFAKSKIVGDSRFSKRAMYRILIECMGNTTGHAYHVDSNYKKWWLMASYFPESNRINFCFVDNGQGIPNTIRRDFKERVMQITQSIAGSKSAKTFKLGDHKLIESALRGEFRSRTKLPHRGNGLPAINNIAIQKQVENLIVISKRAFVNCSKSESRELSGVFQGTLLSWDFI